MWNSPIWPIDRTLSIATTPGQSVSGSNGKEGVVSLEVVTPPCKDLVGLSYSTSWRGLTKIYTQSYVK